MVMTILQGFQTIAVLVGVVFGLIELRQIKRQREVQAGAAMLQSLQTPDTGSTMLLLVGLPDDLPGGDLKARLGSEFDAVVALASMFESLGPLVARGHVPIDIYADYYRGATVVCWRKIRRYVEEQRAGGWSNLFEWFQWLAEQMAKRAPLDSDIPAFERWRDWQPGEA
jgi:hypothetical protein